MNGSVSVYGCDRGFCISGGKMAVMGVSVLFLFFFGGGLL